MQREESNIRKSAEAWPRPSQCIQNIGNRRTVAKRENYARLLLDPNQGMSAKGVIENQKKASTNSKSNFHSALRTTRWRQRGRQLNKNEGQGKRKGITLSKRRGSTRADSEKCNDSGALKERYGCSTRRASCRSKISSYRIIRLLRSRKDFTPRGIEVKRGGEKTQGLCQFTLGRLWEEG